MDSGRSLRDFRNDKKEKIEETNRRAHKMADYLRLRQICLAAPKLEPVVSDIHDIFGVEVCYRDPGVGAFGLQNALFVIGTNFLEIVSPIEPNTAGGRFIERTKGHGGYMAIFQAS